MTPKQFQFCKHFAKGSLSGTEAARLAGYAPSSSTVVASRLLSKPEIQDRIKLFRAKYAEEAGFDKSEAIDQLIAIAGAPSLGTYMEQLPSNEVVWKPVESLTPEQLAALKATIPVRDILKDWQAYHQHDRAVALATLIDLAAPKLDTLKRAAIVSALMRIGKQRGLTDLELSILTDTLREAA